MGWQTRRDEKGVEKKGWQNTTPIYRNLLLFNVVDIEYVGSGNAPSGEDYQATKVSGRSCKVEAQLFDSVQVVIYLLVESLHILYSSESWDLYLCFLILS